MWPTIATKTNDRNIKIYFISLFAKMTFQRFIDILHKFIHGLSLSDDNSLFTEIYSDGVSSFLISKLDSGGAMYHSQKL